MLSKNALAQALFYSILATSLTTLTMDSSSPTFLRQNSGAQDGDEGLRHDTNHAISPRSLATLARRSGSLGVAGAPTEQRKNQFSTTKMVRVPHPFFDAPLKVQIQIQAHPSARTQADRQRCYNMRATQIDAQLQEVLKKYAHNVVTRVNNGCITILPTELFFNAETNTLILRKDLKTHTLTNNISGHLEVRIDASVQDGQMSLKPGTAFLYITPKEKGGKQLKLNMETLHALYPDKASLNLKPEARAQLWQTIARMSCSNLMQREQSDPDKYLDALYTEDVKKMAIYYLTHHMPNN